VPKVLVWGFYGKGNAGDELFKQSFQHLFPEIDFKFVDQLNQIDIEAADAVFLGGGSFLDNPLPTDAAVKQALRARSILYIGVGLETNIHPDHQALLDRAKLIATRSPNQIYPNSIYIPDLVYALDGKTRSWNKQQAILIMSNCLVIPTWNDPIWKQTAWEHFKSEFAQALEALYPEYRIDFYPMCQNATLDDHAASMEILSKTAARNFDGLLCQVPPTIERLTYLFSQYQLVITQRYHGTILAELAGTPCVSIHHHDKLKFTHAGGGVLLPFFGFSKDRLFSAIEQAKSKKLPPHLPIETHLFEELKSRVRSIIGGG
jgi:polysaccharide pyruvyl transferase